MRLRKEQKEAVLRWIVEGLKSDEINDHAAEFIPPFNISTRMVTYYRKTREADIAVLIAAGEQNAMSAGLAVVAVRVKRLKQLAGLMEKDLFGGFLWLEDVKGVGAGSAAEVVDFEKFNAAEVKEYRGLLDDIARELGHRPRLSEITGKDGGPIETKDVDGVTDEERVARITTLLDDARARRDRQAGED
jgi:hypothetical protein